MDHVITMNRINKYYTMGEEKLHVLKDVSLTVDQGDYIAILGPSGSGKSTLMNIIGCMDTPESGEYILDGIAVEQCSEDQLTGIRNREIGFIFQKYQLIPKYTVMQNICMPLIVRGLSRREAEEQSTETIELLGLADRIRHKPNELSGGQQQRVAIARALVGQPNLLLADEPTGALDSATGKEVLKLFTRLNELGHTIIMITHDEKVATFAKRIARITDGCLTMAG